MALKPQIGIEKADSELARNSNDLTRPPFNVSSANLDGVRSALARLKAGAIDEAGMGTAMGPLLDLWSGSLSSHPLLRPLLFLEGARIAEAIDRLAGVPEAGPALVLLRPPFLDQDRDSLVQDGLGKVRKGLLLEAVALLRQLHRPDLEPAIELINAVAQDCAGPLGAVYGV